MAQNVFNAPEMRIGPIEEDVKLVKCQPAPLARTEPGMVYPVLQRRIVISRGRPFKMANVSLARHNKFEVATVAEKAFLRWFTWL